MRWLWSRTIWADEAIPAAEFKYRNLKRAIFPLFYIAGIYAGIGGSVSIPALSQFLPPDLLDLYSYSLISAAAAGLVGAVLPKFWPLEIAGVCLIIGLLAAYATSLLLLILTGHPDRSYALGIALMAVMLAVFRLNLLSGEWQRRNSQKGR